MLCIAGSLIMEWSPLMEQAKKSPENWKKIYGEDVPYLDWNKAYHQDVEEIAGIVCKDNDYDFSLIQI